MAQTNGTDPQVVCVGYIGAYQVDYTENSGAGTIGSTYSWSVITAGFSGFISLNQGPGLSENRVIIDWGATPPGVYQNMIFADFSAGLTSFPCKSLFPTDQGHFLNWHRIYYSVLSMNKSKAMNMKQP